MLGLPDEVTVALFDLDGVLTSTAVLHRHAWKAAFDAFLAERDPDGYAEFTEQDYLDYVDGRPRYDGVRNFLASRGIEVPPETVKAVGDGKNQQFLTALEREGVTPYPGSVAYLTAAAAAGLHIAVVTSSANGAKILDAAGLSKFVEHRVDGITIAERGIRGKPAPDSYLYGAELMGVPAAQAAVFEDAISGVQSGAAGGFGFVVGVDRVGGTQADTMRAEGADIVVGDLQELLTD